MTAVLLALLSTTSGSQEELPLERAGALIQQLDSDSPDERDAAEKELLAAGERVEPLLKKAATDGRTEVRARCQDLLSQIALLRKRREFWNPSKPIHLELKDVPLKDALAAVSKASGHAVRGGDADPEAKISLSLNGVSFFQAVEALCLAGGMWYRWNGSGVELAKRDTPSSRSHAGPLLLTATIGSSSEDGDLALNLHLEWEPGIRLGWYEIELESAEDDQGAAVTPAPIKNAPGHAHRLVYFRSQGLPAESEARFTVEDHLDLATPTKSVTRLKSAKGRLTVFMPEERKTVRFDAPAQGQKTRVGAVEVSLTDFGWGRRNNGGWGASLNLDLTGLPSSKHPALFCFLLSSRVKLIDADGKEFAAENGGASSSGNTGDPLQHVGTSVATSKLPETRPPKALETTVVTDVWERTFPFTFKDVQRPKGR